MTTTHWRVALSRATSVLDIDTGGGDRLASFAAFECRVVATEGWPPNVPLAARRLRAFGVQVVAARSDALPIQDAAFDLVLNRHGGIDAPSIARGLRAGGRFLTQQVDPEGWAELRRYFPRKTEWPENALERRIEEFTTPGGRVTGQRHEYRVAFGGSRIWSSTSPSRRGRSRGWTRPRTATRFRVWPPS